MQSRRLAELAAGFKDSVDDARQYFGHLLNAPAGVAMRETYLRSGPGVIDWFAAHCEVAFVPCGTYPNCRVKPGAVLSRRALATRRFDARVLSRAFRHMRPPILAFLVFGGIMADKDDIPKLVGHLNRWQR